MGTGGEKGIQVECEVCGCDIVGEVAVISAMDDVGGLLKVCESCSRAHFVQLQLEGMGVEVHRNDYIQADYERLAYALGTIASTMEDHGWNLQGVKLESADSTSRESLDE